MGCTSSHSENLPRLPLLTSDEFLQSIHEPPGYFISSLQTSRDFIGSTRSTRKIKTPEMSYNGPPSHLESSADVHPFWAYHGLDFYNNFLSNTSSSEAPPSLFPSAETAQELRQIEVNEALTDLRQQVIGVIADKKSIKKKKEKTPEDDNSLQGLTNDEKLTIEFLESVLRAEDDYFEESEHQSVQSLDALESNWIIGPHKYSHSSIHHDGHDGDQQSISTEGNAHPVPGHMHDIVTECDLASQGKPVDREDSFLHKPVYLPNNDVLIVDADCEIGTNTKTSGEDAISTVNVNSSRSSSSRSSRISITEHYVTEQYIPDTEQQMNTTNSIANENNEDLIDFDTDTQSNDFVKTIYPETQVPPDVNDHNAVEVNDSAIETGGANEEFSLEAARSASATTVRGSKVFEMVQMFDQKVRESFGEADKKSKGVNREKTSEGEDEQVDDIAKLLMDGTGSNGKTQVGTDHNSDTMPVILSQERSGTSLKEPLAHDIHSSDNNESILGQIKKDLVLLQQGESNDDGDDDDDYGRQESIDSGFVN
ncbi:uncharacterized protein [Ptychodera flava]|uniref:uncharacterized protein n=1 Tax=Ptychodera flava TaxID=63121 RepID=UPI00396A81F0